MATTWRQELKKETGRNSTSEERRAIKDAYVSRNAVDTRMGEGAYDALREQEIQKQFGTKGYDSGSKGEKRRFDKRFNRQLRNDRLTLSPKLPVTPVIPTVPVTQDQNFIIYPWNWNTYQIRPRGGLFPQSFIYTSYFPEAEAGLSEEKTTQDVMESNLDKNKIKFLDTVNNKAPGVIDLGGSRFDKSKFNEEQLQFLHNMFNQNYSYKGVTPNFSKVAFVKDGLQHTYYLDDLELNSIDNFNTGLTLFPDGSVAKVTDNGLHFLDDNFKNHPNFRPAYLKGPNQTVTIDGITYPSAVSTGLFGNNYGIKNDHTYAYDAETNSIRKVHENLFGEVSRGNKVRWAPNSEWINLSNIPSNYNVFYQKQGGKMNKINYFQKGGKNLPTAPNAKEAYKGGTYKDGLNIDIISSKPIEDYSNRTLVRRINPITQDTVFIETPEKFDPTLSLRAPISRKASSSDKDRSEYEILNRRFNEGASVINDTITLTPKKIINWIKPYFQQGGQMQQQDVQQQIIQLVQAAMQGDQQATQTIQQVMQAAEQGDQQAQQLAQMIQQVAEQMKGQATMAKWGSKLKYIKNLKYAKGGKTCLECQQGGNISTTSNNSLKNPLKKSVNKVEEKACGGKTKKIKK